MAPLGDRIASLIGSTILKPIRKHDSKLFTRSPIFLNHPEPTLIVRSLEAADGLEVRHTSTGGNRFPGLAWAVPEAYVNNIVQYLVIVEDADTPRPSPAVLGIYYGIPYCARALIPDAIKYLETEGEFFLGGEEPSIGYGHNRKGNVWSGPKPPLGHGKHRYFFQVVGLDTWVDWRAFGEHAPRACVLKGAMDHIVAWGEWVGEYERRLVSL